MSEIVNTTKKLTVAEYHESITILGPFVLVYKEQPPEQYSNIILPPNTKDSARDCSTGVIIKTSVNILDNLYDRYLHSVLKSGMRVGFSPAAPIHAPVSMASVFVDTNDARLVKKDTILIHYQDILAVFPENKEQFAKDIEACNAYFKPLFPSYQGDLDER